MNIDNMYDAIFDGDCERIDDLINQGFDVNFQVEHDNWNLLHMALVSVTIHPEPKVIKHLVDLGVDPNHKDRYLNTPLHYASRTKNLELIKILLDAGVEIDPVNQELVTPLRMTLLSKPYNYEATKFLLLRGANPNHECKGCSVKKFAELISHGEDKNLVKLFDEKK